jgi:hypothetical protein
MLLSSAAHVGGGWGLGGVTARRMQVLSSVTTISTAGWLSLLPSVLACMKLRRSAGSDLATH